MSDVQQIDQDEPADSHAPINYSGVTDRQLLEAIHSELRALNKLRQDIETYGPEAVEKLKSNPIFGAVGKTLGKIFQ